MPRGKRVMSITDLEKMLDTRRSELSKLQSQRDSAMTKVQEIDQQIAKLGGTTSSSSSSPSAKAGSTEPRRRRSGKRAKNAMSLVATLEEALRGKEPMQVGDIVSAVESLGYRSNSANFRGIVNQTLIKDKKFTQSGRGLYHLK